MTTPPFHADHVGSYLRPVQLVETRRRYSLGEVDFEELRSVEDGCIRELVSKQESVGLQGITDGEYRRAFFHIDFLEQLDGVTIEEGRFLARFKKDDGTEMEFVPQNIQISGKILHSAPIQGQDFDFLKSTVTRTPKVTIPSPSMLHFRGGRNAISATVYPDLEEFYSDLAAAYRSELADLATRGCRYLQMDDTNLAYLCDPDIRQNTINRGDDPDALTKKYCELINECIKDKPADMTIAVHLCRGNFKSAWVARGGYEPVADILFNEMKVNGFFLEYDDERSGDFAPLRLVPKDKIIVLGLMSSKHAAVENKETLLDRIKEASRYIPLGQCRLSHQCGFSSTAHGNELSEDDQWRKLERCVDVAGEVWR